MNKQYTILTKDGKLLIKTTINSDNIEKRLIQISKRFHVETLVIQEEGKEVEVWTYDRARDIRQRLEEVLNEDFDIYLNNRDFTRAIMFDYLEKIGNLILKRKVINVK